MNDIEVQRLLSSPLGQAAAPGTPGDIVSVSDGEVAVYLTPAEFDSASEAHLRWLLAAKHNETATKHSKSG